MTRTTVSQWDLYNTYYGIGAHYGDGGGGGGVSRSWQ